MKAEKDKGLTIKNKYAIGDMVYLVSDPDKVPAQIIFIQINPNGLLYGLSWAGELQTHFEMEIEAIG